MAAFENHLHFLELHRGNVARDADGIWVHSEAEGFTSWTPIADTSPVPEDCPAVRVAPWSGLDWEAGLSGLGFGQGETLTYMKLADGKAMPQPSGIEIVRAEDEAGARIFADVQAAGFASGDVAVDTWWKDFFEQMAIRNVSDPDQDFYIGLLDGIAVGCTLVVHRAGVAGIYAVATRPEYRNRGVSGALLEEVRVKAANAGEPVVLGAMKGSYAEGYYSRLGFETLYQLTVWRREGMEQ